MNGAHAPAPRAAFKEFVLRMIHPFRLPVSWACQHGIITPEVRNVLPWRWVLEPFTIYGPGWRFRWSPTEFDSIAHRMFWSGFREWERDTTPTVIEKFRRARYFIDIGANCGIYTVMACVVNPEIRVLAIEPVSRICETLKRNVEINGFGSRVAIINAAVADSNGIVSFHEAEDATMGSLGTTGYHGQRGRVIQVRCRTLDDVVAELGVKPDFLKIDVEGAEDVVLAGASSTLKVFRPSIVLEANPGDPAERMTEILVSSGYSFQLLTERGPIRHNAIVPVDGNQNWLCEPI